ncbi:MAG TPA: amidase [Symbiobacteriaceae bacterium]|nr:amidase [Symbiobacteriaceae bacterium]
MELELSPKTARRLEALLADARRYEPLAGRETRPAFLPPAAAAVKETVIGTSATGPAQAALARISAADGELHAFVAVLPAGALQQAGDGPLCGVPVAVKDLIDVAGLPTRAGSRITDGAPAAADAAVVGRLRRAGAVIVGKTTTHEFAYGVTTDGTRNPADPRRIPGGSSGGSAAAVAAGMVPIALGTDTAGSVRIPAACCGVVGFKPTFGRVSTQGVVPLSWSLDHVGPLTRTVSDAALTFSVMANAKMPPRQPLTRLRIGLPTAWLATPVAPAVRQAFERSLQNTGADLVEVALPPLDRFHFVSRVITLAEAGAYHAPNLDRLSDYGPDVGARIELGQFIPAREYLLAQRLRTELCQAMAEVMTAVDALATPTIPLPAPLIGQRWWDGPDGHREPVADTLLRFAAPFNITGQPAISLPCGTTPDGLPIGLQLIGAVHQDERLLQLALTVQAAIGAH